MSEWPPVPFGQIAKKLVNGGTPPTDVSRYWSGQIPWITGADFTPAGIGEFRRFVSDDAIRETATNVIEEGQLLLVTRTGVGKLAIAPCNIAISQDVTGVYVDEEQADTVFLFHRMRQGVEDLKKLNQGTSINGIIRSDLVAYLVKLPPLSQQRRIAEILSTLDEEIEQTEALIAKMQQVKAGLMHDLFTRGVTPDGRLRPTREQAPELYKESPIGWIPREWEVSTLGDACEWYSGGTPSRAKEEWWGGDFPWLTPKDMKSFELSDTSEHVTLEAASVASRIVGADSIFIVVRGMILAHSFPVVLGLREFSFNQDIKAIRVREKLLSRFMVHWLVAHTWLFLKKTTEATHGTKRFDLREISKVQISIPEKAEQEMITDRIDSLSIAIQSEQETDLKLRLQKHGLMHDLLTGQLRIIE